MKNLILIDGHALAYRQYFALERTAMSTTDNQPTWAVYGFFKAIFDLLKNKKINPDAIAVTFDVHRENFRMKEYKEYKANRESMPDNMRSQMGLIQEGLKAFNIPIYTKEGFEADDVIGTISKKASEIGCKTYILTGDQDSFQLIDKEDMVTVLIPSKGELIEYDWFKVHDKLGVYPNQIIDYKALRGDTSDNIPGIKGIGEKTAQNLLGEYQTLDNVFANVDNIKQKALKEKIQNGYDVAMLSKKLATIVRNVDIDFNFDTACIELPDVKKVSSFLQKMQFHSYVKNLTSILMLFKPTCDNGITSQDKNTQLGLFSQVVEQELVEDNPDHIHKEISDINDLIKAIENQKFLSINIDTLENDKDIISEISFGYKDKDLIKTYSLKADSNLKSNLLKLKNILENKDIKKTTYDSKNTYIILKKYGITLNGIQFDTLLSSYVKDPSRQHDLRTQAFECLNNIISNENIDGKYAYIILKLTKYWENELNEKELKLVNEIEVPLSIILANMEIQGVSLDTEYLKNLTEEFDKDMKALEKEIFEIAGSSFNVNSPKQVSEILYKKLKYKPRRKGKNKYSTSADVLEEIAVIHPIAQYLLQYRQYAKLKSTYTDALPDLISKKDGKIHTSFNQTITATGRLSSSNPNLQNIPTRSKEGIKIRKAFIPSDRENQVLLSADYSQIELRLLAHCSNDEKLIKAFNNDEDIHAQTAANVFNVSLDEVTKEMRTKAKAVNFGIIYGQSQFGLSKALNIEIKEAKEFIQKYFETYPAVKEYMDKTIEFAHKNGYVETIFGRKRYLGANLNSSNKHIMEAAERAAINQPLQGSAADLIKMAMITLNRRLTENELKSKMILQVHDELIIEVPIDELEIVKTIVKESMELNQPLKVPLLVDVAFGKNWIEL